jgi:hypothetical protein
MNTLPRTVLSGVLAFATIAGAWAPDGHRIIGEVATRSLSPEARAAVERILAGRSLAEVSTWADEVRGSEPYRWSAPLHYANIEPGAAAFDPARDCPAEGCIVKAIGDMTGVLRDPSTPDDKREEALKFLVHFVGDIHQPLHVSFARDRGGNSITVTVNDIPTNLHRFWDGGSVEAAGKDWPTYSADLIASITPDQRGAWSSADPTVWANESYQLSVSVAYIVPADGRLDQPYIDRAAAVARVRLATAGERLAGLLNDIFSPPPAAEPPPAEAAPVQVLSE